MINPHNNKVKEKVISNGVNVDTALKLILKDIRILAAEPVKLTDSVDRVLAEDIYAGANIPRFNNSAMDGYAVRNQDLTGAASRKPVVLKVVDDIPAGVISKREVKKGQAARIMTGAIIPKGADSVVMVEDTRKAKNKKFVEIFKEAKAGENIRKCGEDVKKGELVISRNTLLKPAHIGLLASLGKPRVKVIRRPKIAVLATGNELAGLGGKLKPGEIRSSNTYTLCAQILKCGGIPLDLGIAKDDKGRIRRKIEAGLESDMLVVSGGVSVGDYDYVKDVIKDLNGRIKFWKAAIRPGKPLVFGVIKGRPVFGLPGNPVSSMVSFEIFVRPAIRKMLGQRQDPGKHAQAVLEEDIVKKRGFRYFLRAKTHWQDRAYYTRTTGPQGSGILKSMAIANSLIVLSEDKEFYKKGGTVRVKFLD